MRSPRNIRSWLIAVVLVVLIAAGGAFGYTLLRDSTPEVAAVAVAEIKPPPVRPSYLVEVPQPTPEMLKAQEEQRRQAELTVAALTVEAESRVPEEEVEGDRWTVTAEAVNVRSGPSNLSDVLGKLLQGETINVTEEDSGWLKFAGANGTGWVYSKNLARQ